MNVSALSLPKQSIPEDQTFWHEHLGLFLSPLEVQRRLGIEPFQVTELTQQHRLLALPTTDGPAYPAFQFDADGALNSTISRVIGIMAGIVATPYTIAAWLTDSTSDLLEGKTPLRWLRDGGDPARVIEAADVAAARLDR